MSDYLDDYPMTYFFSKWRLDHHQSRADVADLLGISRATVEHYYDDNGWDELPRETLVKYAKRLGLTLP